MSEPGVGDLVNVNSGATKLFISNQKFVTNGFVESVQEGENALLVSHLVKPTIDPYANVKLSFVMLATGEMCWVYSFLVFSTMNA